MTASPLVGLLVGGRASRMGGIAKGLLRSPDGGEPIVARLARVTREALPGVEVVLVGNAPAYSSLGLHELVDAPPGVGPLGGISALLAAARERGVDAIAVAGDLPFVTSEMVIFLSTFAPDAAAVAPRIDGTWQPLFARYSPPACEPLVRTMLSEGRLAPWRLLDALSERAASLPLDAATGALLTDWDTPDDAALTASPLTAPRPGPIRS